MINLSAIVLAAGCSLRMGAANKLLLPFKNKTILEVVLEAVSTLPFREIIVISGHNRALVEQHLLDFPVHCIYNPDYASGISASLKKGILTADGNSEGFLICLGDMPFISSGMISLLCHAFVKKKNKQIIIPVFQKKRGNPVIFSRHFRDDLLKIEGDKGGSSIIRQYPEIVVEVDMYDDGVLKDIDDMDTYKKIQNKNRGFSS